MKYVGGLIGAEFNESRPSQIKDKSYDNLFKVSTPICLVSKANIITIELEMIYGTNNVFIFFCNRLFFFDEYSENKYPEIIDNMAVPYVGTISKRK